jgi:hypothetical protein
MELATPETPDAELQLNPSLMVGQYGFPVARFYHEVRENRSPVPPMATPTCVAIVRKDYLTTTILLDESHYGLLKAICETNSVKAALIAHAASSVTEQDIHNAWKNGQVLRESWIGAGFFVRVPELT